MVFEDRELSYAALDAHANRLANHLRSLGVGPDVLVGVCAERSVELVVGLLAVLKAGGAYVPLEPEHPAGRLAGMVTDAGLGVVLTQRALAPRLALPAGTRCVLLDGEELRRRGRCDDAGAAGCRAICTARHLAYMIYTSGSTGTPKGAANTHAGLHNRLAWMQDAYGLGGRRRGAAEDAVRLRRVGVGVLLAADGGCAAGGGGARRAPRAGAADRDDRDRRA